MGKEPLLQLENLKVDFFLRSWKATAIHGLDLQLERGKPRIGGRVWLWKVSDSLSESWD